MIKISNPLKKKSSKAATQRDSGRRPASSDSLPTYRRNRTITDRSTVPGVTERARANYLRSVRRRVGFILAIILVALIVVGTAVSQLSGSVEITNSQTSLTKNIDQDRYSQLFDDYYKQHPLERFRFLTNYDRLTASLQQEAPEVQSIEPNGIGGIGVSRYELLMRRPVASWMIESSRFYVDASGVTFTENYYQEPAVSVVDNSGAVAIKGSAIASSRLLSFVGRVVALSEENGILINSIEIPSSSMRQLYLKGKGMPTVRVTIDRTAENQVKDMAEALDHLKRHKQSPGYIDVRVRGKAFYK